MKEKKFSKELDAWKNKNEKLINSELGQFVLQIRKNLVQDLGGPEVVTASMDIMLDMISQKIFLIYLMNQHANDKQDQLIDKKGELLPCLGKHYLAYCNSVRVDITVLNELGRINSNHRSGAINLEDYVNRKYGAKDEKTNQS